MNKGQLIDGVAAATGLSRNVTKRVIETTLETIGATLQSDEAVELVGFGTFETKFRIAREGRDPRTGRAITIPTHYAPIFRPGSELKRRVNERG